MSPHDRVPGRDGARVGRTATTFAAWAAFAYLLFTGHYIVLSGALASSVASSLEELTRIEQLKGLVFVSSTAVLFFVLGRLALLRIARLAVALEESRAAFIASQQRATAARCAAAIAHDFNNVLTIAGAALDELRDARTPEERSQLVGELEEAMHRAEELTRRLFGAVRGQDEEAPATVDLRALVEETVASLAHRELWPGSLRVVTSASVSARVLPVLVRQIVVNLLLNAKDATTEAGRGRIEVHVERVETDAIRLLVEDDGPGVPEALEQAIFEPFFTTKATGTGLGLFSVRVCAERHGGSVEVSRSPTLGGARFVVILREASEAEPGALQAPR